MIDRSKDHVKVFGPVQEKSTEERYKGALVNFVSFMTLSKDLFSNDESLKSALDETVWNGSKIHALLGLVFKKKYSVNVNRLTDPVYLFLAHYGMGESKMQFKEPHEMTGILAALKYLIRLLIFMEIEKDPSILEGMNELNKSILLFVKRNSLVVTPFGMVSEMMGLLTVAQNNLIGKSNVQIDHERPGETLFFKGALITKSGIRASIKKALYQAQVLAEDLCLGVDIAFLDSLLENHRWREPLRNQVRGGSILKSDIVVDVTRKFLNGNPNFKKEFNSNFNVKVF
jgi:hypothetical protein